MTTKLDWQSRAGDSWAAEWQRTDRSFGGLTDQLIGKASERPVRYALDVGCGAGEVSLSLGRSYGNAEIIGIDLSANLIEVAQSRGVNLPNVSFQVGDAAEWDPADYAPDLIVSRHGVMFFDNPVTAFTHLAQIAALDARLVFSCFRSLEENPWAERIESFLPHGAVVPTDRFSPGPFAFADQTHVEGILRDAGWIDIEFQPVDYAYVAGAGPDATEDAIDYFQRIGPAVRAAAALHPEEKTHFLERLRRYLDHNNNGQIVALRASAWIVSAKPGCR